jgi:hypothetical protein
MRINITFKFSGKETGHSYIINLISIKIRVYILEILGNYGVFTERSVVVFNIGASYSLDPEFEPQQKLSHILMWFLLLHSLSLLLS